MWATARLVCAWEWAGTALPMSEPPPRSGVSPFLLAWLSGVLLLGVMSVTLFLVGMFSVGSSSLACEDPDSSTGECLVTSEQHRMEKHLVTDGAVTLGVGALVCLGGAGVAGLAGTRRS
jgi:hypothetical protein